MSLDGSKLATKVAAGGTAMLFVDHDEECYYMDLAPESDLLMTDLAEILDLVYRHGFELMGVDEMPAERTVEGGWRLWLAHKDGTYFGDAA